MTDLVEQLLDEEEDSTAYVIKDIRRYDTIARRVWISAYPELAFRRQR